MAPPLDELLLGVSLRLEQFDTMKFHGIARNLHFTLGVYQAYRVVQFVYTRPGVVATKCSTLPVAVVGTRHAVRWLFVCE